MQPSISQQRRFPTYNPKLPIIHRIVPHIDLIQLPNMLRALPRHRRSICRQNGV